MNITTVAVTNSYNDTVTMLPPSAKIDGVGHVLFHNNPRLEFDGENNVTNFDYHIDFRITKNKLHAELMSDKYHHYPRLKRRTQYLNVFKFNKDRAPELQITIPHYYMATLREGEHVGITNFGIPKCEKVVIKEQLGARGSNQVVVPTNMLTTLLKHSKGKTLGEVRDVFPDLIYTDNSDWDMLFFDNPNDLFVSELITNVKSEYRLLVGGDMIYGRERAIKAGPYPQANLETDKFHTVQEVTYEPIEDMFDTGLVETLYDFAEFINLPIGSIDLYSTTDGEWGIFEYSTQFAFHGANPNFIKQLLLDGVKLVLAKSGACVRYPDSKTNPVDTVGEQIRKHVDEYNKPINNPNRESIGGIVYNNSGRPSGNVVSFNRESVSTVEFETSEQTDELVRHFIMTYALVLSELAELGIVDDPHHVMSINWNNVTHGEWSLTVSSGKYSLLLCDRTNDCPSIFLTHESKQFNDWAIDEVSDVDVEDLVRLKNAYINMEDIVKEITESLKV